MNSVVNRGAASTALAGLSGLKQGLQNVQTSIVTPGGDYLLRMLRDGSWVYGAENVEVEDKSEWAVNPLSLMHGWIAWTDYAKRKNEILGEVMVPASQPLPDVNSLRELKDTEGNAVTYSQQIGFQLQCLTGEDTGEQVRYKATSVGGMNASKELIGEIIKQLDADPDNPVPVLVLSSDNYQHKTYGKTFTPVFEIVDWVPLDNAIKEPLKDTPDSDVKEPEQQAAATRQRTRTVDTAAQGQGEANISAEDRKSAIDGAMADLARERQQSRQTQAAAPAEEAGPGRRRRRA